MFKMVTKTSDIDRLCKSIVQIIDDCVVEEFTEWAKKDDEYLRSNDGFYDHTGNLRSSLGAAVIKDAKIAFMTSFSPVLHGSKGSAAGKQAIERIAADYQGRIAKVMVAGMDYAQKVEDIDSKDVMESRRIRCEQEAQGVFERAMHKAEEKINSL